MIKNKIIKLGATSLIVMSILGTGVFASSEGFGSSGVGETTNYTLEDMLEYALEDEYLAHAEYELIIYELDAARPFTNIVKAEETHIKLVEGLYEDYGFELPVVDPSDYISVPASITDALEAGVAAEIANIGMYDTFLSQDLPDDVRVVFEYLKRASESHLAAFEGNNGFGQSQGARSRGNAQNQGVRGRGNTMLYR